MTSLINGTLETDRFVHQFSPQDWYFDNLTRRKSYDESASTDKSSWSATHFYSFYTPASDDDEGGCYDDNEEVERSILPFPASRPKRDELQATMDLNKSLPLQGVYGVPSVLLASSASSQRHPSAASSSTKNDNMEEYFIGSSSVDSPSAIDDRAMMSKRFSQRMVPTSSSSSSHYATEDSSTQVFGLTSLSGDQQSSSNEAADTFIPSHFVAAAEFNSAPLRGHSLEVRIPSASATTPFNTFSSPSSFENSAAPQYLSVPQPLHSSPALSLGSPTWHHTSFNSFGHHVTPSTSLTMLDPFVAGSSAAGGGGASSLLPQRSMEASLRTTFPAFGGTSSSPSNASLTTTGAAKRVPAACNFCRVRKLRCDGQVPCRQCARRAIECVYSEAAETRKRRRRAATVSELPLSGVELGSSSITSSNSSAQQPATYFRATNYPNTTAAATTNVPATSSSSSSSGNQQMLRVPVVGGADHFRPQRPHSQSFTQQISYTPGVSLTQAPTTGQSLSSWTLSELGMGLAGVAPNLASTSPFQENPAYFTAFDLAQQQQQQQSQTSDRNRPPF